MLGTVGSVQASQTRCPWWIGWYTSAWCCCTVASLLVDCCMDSLIFHDMRSMLQAPVHVNVPANGHVQPAEYGSRTEQSMPQNDVQSQTSVCVWRWEGS